MCFYINIHTYLIQHRNVLNGVGKLLCHICKLYGQCGEQKNYETTDLSK